jgi:hypothetical protein
MFIVFARKKLFFDSANKGKAPCPSCTIELASNVPKGIEPLINSVTKIKWGPDSGITPINTASIKIITWFDLIHASQ